MSLPSPAKGGIREASKLLKRKKKRKNRRSPALVTIKRLVAILFIIEGLILFGQTVYLHGPTTSQFLKKKVEKAVAGIIKEPDNRFGTVEVAKEALTEKINTNHPTRILIPKIGLEQPVEDGKIVDGQWNISESGASYMIGSCAPGNPCNIVVYGHAKEQIFGPLKKIKTGDSITILTETKWYLYKVSEIKDVSPEQISVIGPTSEETLTLFTCTAFLDSKRLVVVAKRA